MDIHAGEKIKEYFAITGLSVSEFARRLHCHRQNVYDIFKRKTIDVTLLKQLFRGKYRCANGIFSKAGLCCVAVANNEPCNAGDGNNDLPPCNLHWSVIDTSGRMVLDNVKVESFVDGLALVNLSNNPLLHLDDEGMVTLGDGKFIFMDTTGKRVFDRTFLQANSFSEGLAYVKEMDGTTGFINDKGEMVLLLPKGYAVYSNGFKNGIVEISHIEKRGKYTDHTTQWINRKGQTLWKIEYRTRFN